MRLWKHLQVKYKLLLMITPVVIVIDQIVKIYVDQTMELYQTIEIVENYFNLTYIRNKGAAFGMLANMDEAWRVPFFLCISVIAIGAILYTLHAYKDSSRIFPVALAMILGGAVGNMIDRARLGEVIDFILVHWHQYHWPAFNVADSAITVGVGMLILHMFHEERKT